MVNHTVQLINANALDGIHTVIDRGIKVDCIITRFNREYFYEETMRDTLKDVAKHLCCALIDDGTTYVELALKDISIVLDVFSSVGFNLLNILTIPKKYDKKPCHPKKYIDDDLNYALFFSKQCSVPRYINPIMNSEDKCSCQISANWSWFSGTNIDSYREMMKISTDHGQIVLDPFMDNGDVGVAAILQDRNFIGIEISKARFDDAQRRLAELGE